MSGHERDNGIRHGDRGLRTTGYRVIASADVERAGEGLFRIVNGPSMLFQNVGDNLTQIAVSTHQNGQQLGHILMAKPFGRDTYQICKVITNTFIPANAIIIGYRDPDNPIPSDLHSIRIDSQNPSDSIRFGLAEQNIVIDKGAFFIALPKDPSLTTPIESI